MSIETGKILHIVNDYSGSSVYKNLICELDRFNFDQIIYTAVREKSKVGSNEVRFFSPNSEIIYSPILNWNIDRVFYPYKLFKILKDIQSKVDLTKIQCIHAHTWYSDGGVAYYLSKKYNIPMVVAIRNTDLNVFQNKLAYLRPFGRKILSHSKKVILISASYYQRVLSLKSLVSIKDELIEKIEIIPNGVDPYWIENVRFKKKTALKKIVHLLYIGRFTTGKRVPSLQQAVILLNKEGKTKVVLHLVGDGGADSSKVKAIAEKNPEYFQLYGKVNDKVVLKDIINLCDIFTMPSIHETFGLVYVEAMLQGLPVLFTQGEGIDGYYSDNVGEKVVRDNVYEIKDKIRKLIVNYESYILPIDLIKKNHDWRLIAEKYKKIYINLMI